MKNKREKDEIYRAFDAISSPDNRTKQRILNSVMNKERKGYPRFVNIAVPAAVFVMISANAAMISTALDKNHNDNDNESSNIFHTTTADNSSTSEIYSHETSSFLMTSMSAVYTDTTHDFTSVYTTTVPETTVSLSETSSESEYISATESYISETQTAINEITTTIPEQTTISETISETPDTSIATAEEGSLLPPLSPELQSFFNEAYEVYKQYSLGGNYMFLDFDENNDYNYENDIEIDGRTYSRTSEKYFTTMQDVYDYFHQYFTDNFINTIYIYSHFVEYDGRVYAELWGKGGNIGYAGHTYQITMQTDNEIDIDVDCYISNDMENFDDTMIFHAPEDMSKYELLERQIILKKEDGQWRVDKVELMW